MKHPVRLQVQSLAPHPQLFFDSCKRIFEETEDTLILNLSPVFPFEERSDALYYDEQLFSALFRWSQRIQLEFAVYSPFWIPGKNDWTLPFDLTDSDGAPLLASRIIRAVEDIQSLGYESPLPVLLSCSEATGISGDVQSRLEGQAGGAEFVVDCPRMPETVPAGFSALELPLWEEQMMFYWPELMADFLTDWLDFNALEHLDKVWTEYVTGVARSVFSRSTACMNRYTSGVGRGDWPFSSRKSVTPASTDDIAFSEFVERMHPVLRNRSESSWYNHFLRSLNLMHCSLLASSRDGSQLC